MKSRRDGWGPTIAISISETPDLNRLGMSSRHLERAMQTIATYLLSFGYRLAYGGDLRRDGFAEQLFELASRYDRSPQSHGRPAVTDYLPWSACASISLPGYRDLSSRLGVSAEIKCLAQDGTVLDHFSSPDAPLDKREIASSLSAMRRTMLQETSARVVLGGRVEGYQGSMPGIAEEALLTLEAGRPLYVIGGFGGCARDIAESLELVDALYDPARSSWDGHEEFVPYGADSLSNGLSYDENCTLARTPHIRQAVALIRRGLNKTPLTDKEAI